MDEHRALRVALADASALVTGAGGFIGSHICEALCKAGARVVAVGPVSEEEGDNLASVKDQIEVVPVRLTARHMRSLFDHRAFDVVFHFAGSADPGTSDRAPLKDFRQNTALTVSLLDACRQAKHIPAVVFASSGAVYGHSGVLPVPENAPTQPITPYGASKLASEVYARVYSHRFRVPTAVMRIFSAYGPRLRRQVVHDLLTRLNESPTSLTVRTTGDETRDFIFIDDVVSAALTIASFARFEGEPYNVGSGTETSIRTLAELIVGRLARHACTITFEDHMDTTGAARWCADVRRLRGLGWAPTIGIDEGISRTAEWLSNARSGELP